MEKTNLESLIEELKAHNESVVRLGNRPSPGVLVTFALQDIATRLRAIENLPSDAPSVIVHPRHTIEIRVGGKQVFAINDGSPESLTALRNFAARIKASDY